MNLVGGGARVRATAYVSGCARVGSRVKGRVINIRVQMYQEQGPHRGVTRRPLLGSGASPAALRRAAVARICIAATA